MVSHPALARHLKKLGLSADRPPTREEWIAHLGHVDQAFQEADEDRYTLERSIEVSGEEMAGLYERLQRERDNLRASQGRFQKLSDSGIIGIAIGDESGTIREANDAYLRALGCSRSDLENGRINWRNLRPADWKHGSSTESQMRTAGAVRPFETEYLRKDGSRVPVLVGLAAFNESSAIAFLADLTDLRRAEDALRQSEVQLRQAQKMEAVGNLAGGVAHDFNNMLSVILSYASLLIPEFGADDPRRADLLAIQDAGERAAGLTRQLLAFSRKQVLQPRTIDLNELVVGMEKMLRRLIGEDIDLAVALAPSLDHVRVDPGQIEQVLMNLVVNSRDAMPRGGKLTVETGRITLDAAYAAAHPGAAIGPHVMLAVSDNGQGMDATTQARIFEPFFTTKEVGKGTGLGLSTTYGIVKQSGGSIWVYSQPAQGTVFKVYLPLAEQPCHGTGSAPAPHIERGSGETILLVEDEEPVRIVVAAILRRFGYRVIVAQDGGDALVRCREFDGKIDLLLTDVVMPRMNGQQLADQICTMRPAVCVLYMSGYTDRAIVHQGVLDPSVAFLQKPITPEALTAKVADVLKGNGQLRHAMASSSG